MRNPLTIQIESYLGAFYISAWTLFLASLIFISIKNFNSEIDILDSTHPQIVRISQAEKILIDEWVAQNNIEVLDGRSYRYIKREYPLRPWLN